MIIAGFSAYMGIVDWARFRKIADDVGAYLLVDMAHVSGLVAGGVYPSPVPFAHVVTNFHKSLRVLDQGLFFPMKMKSFKRNLTLGFSQVHKVVL